MRAISGRCQRASRRKVQNIFCVGWNVLIFQTQNIIQLAYLLCAFERRKRPLKACSQSLHLSFRWHMQSINAHHVSCTQWPSVVQRGQFNRIPYSASALVSVQTTSWSASAHHHTPPNARIMSDVQQCKRISPFDLAIIPLSTLFLNIIRTLASISFDDGLFWFPLGHFPCALPQRDCCSTRKIGSQPIGTT